MAGAPSELGWPGSGGHQGQRLPLRGRGGLDRGPACDQPGCQGRLASCPARAAKDFPRRSKPGPTKDAHPAVLAVMRLQGPCRSGRLSLGKTTVEDDCPKVVASQVWRTDSTTWFSRMSTSMPDRMNVAIASAGVHTIGSFSFSDVFSTTGTPVSRSKAAISA